MSKPQLFLAADPQALVEVQGLFRSQDAEVVRLLESPDQLRRGGWDLSIAGQTEIIRGQLRRKNRSGYKVLQASREGNIMFLARGDEEFLCWASKQRGEGHLAINPIALAEVVYNFVVFSQKVLQFAEPLPASVRFYLQLQNMRDDAGLATLRPDRVGPGTLPMSQAYVAPGPDFATETEYPLNQVAASVAFTLIKELYLWFGIPVDNIPYADVDAGVIDKKTILD